VQWQKTNSTLDMENGGITMKDEKLPSEFEIEVINEVSENSEINRGFSNNARPSSKKPNPVILGIMILFSTMVLTSFVEVRTESKEYAQNVLLIGFLCSFWVPYFISR